MTIAIVILSAICAIAAVVAYALRHRFLVAPRFRRRQRPAASSDRTTAQLQAVTATGFETVPLLGAAEARFLPLIEAATAEFGPGHRVMAQTSLGELLCPTGGADAEAAYAAICTKRLDFSIFDPRGMLVAAIDCTAHRPAAKNAYPTTTPRDVIKREALRKAGVPVIELPADATEGLIRSRIGEILAPKPKKVPPRPRKRPSNPAHA